jgi:PAS domain S-box-containing protein
MQDNIDQILDSETFRIAVDHVPLHIVITDPNGKIIYANKAVEKITGYSNEEIIGQNPKLWGGQMDKSFYEEFWHAIKHEKQEFSGIIINKRKNGRSYFAAIRVVPILDKNQNIEAFCGIEQDITEIQKLSDEHDTKQRQANYLKQSIQVLKPE